MTGARVQIPPSPLKELSKDSSFFCFIGRLEPERREGVGVENDCCPEHPKENGGDDKVIDFVKQNALTMADKGSSKLREIRSVPTERREGE